MFGIYSTGEDVARTTYFGLYALQHRGQESAGIAVSDGEEIRFYKNMGLVSQVFSEDILRQLEGHIAIGPHALFDDGIEPLGERPANLVRGPAGQGDGGA